jgi:hypothetical protein
MNGTSTIRGPSTVATPPRPRDQLTPHLAEDLLDLLCEAGTEINNLVGGGNVVASRLRAMRERIEMARVIVEGGGR